jgi:hypothetical protein
LAVFDKHFQRLWRAKDFKIIIQRNSVNLVPVPQTFMKAKLMVTAAAVTPGAASVGVVAIATL